MKNIIFTWMPWSWKTTIGKKLAEDKKCNFIDFDDDILEKMTLQTSEEVIWLLNLRKEHVIPEDLSNTEVKDLLQILWEDKFLQLEWYLWEKLIFEKPTVLSTSWSLPLELDAMNHLKKDWKVIYIDTKIDSILKRLEQMKTDRIIWIWKMTLEQILNHRKKFYDLTKDYNFEVPEFDLEIERTKIRREFEKEMIYIKFLEFYKNQKIWEVIS